MLLEVLEITLKAGNAIMEIYDGFTEVSYKTDDSPVTNADRMANDLIRAELFKEFPDIPFITEEDANLDYNVRQHWDLCWLIDPIDGTREFINKNGEFTVNIALAKQGTPVFGVVYAPALNVLYFTNNESSFKTIINADSTPESIVKQGIKLPLAEKNSEYTIAISRSHQNETTLNYIQTLKQSGKNVNLIPMGSSLKICMVAEGTAHEYPRFGTTMEWDTAAAHAIALNAGCSLADITDNKEILYNKPSLRNPQFITRSKKVYGQHGQS
jgi:3'(2'), 5'-bisphosphate nucleotidase